LLKVEKTESIQTNIPLFFFTLSGNLLFNKPQDQLSIGLPFKRFTHYPFKLKSFIKSVFWIAITKYN